MLQYGTVEPYTLDILKGLIKVPELKDFYLVGGTALSLYFGHRKSIDLDLFSITEFQADLLIAPLEKNYPGFTYANTHNPIGLLLSLMI